MLSKKRPPTIKDTDRLVAEIYRDINEIIDSVNRPSDLGGRETEGRTGALRLVRLDKNQRFVEFRFEDGWHQIRTTDTNIIANAEVVPPATDHHHDDRYSKLDHHHDARYSQLGHLHDSRYGQLAAANTWTQINTFQSPVVVPDATLDTHAVSKGQGNTLWVVLTRILTAGNGLTGGGSLAADRAFALGTPGSLSNGSTNEVTAESHTHAITNFAVGGTTNQVMVAGAGRVLGAAITLSLPQDIHTSATPRFARLGLGQAADGTYSIHATNAVNAGEYRVGTSLTITNDRHANIISAEGDSFTSGWAGSGWRITTTAEMELSNLWVRGRLNVYELLINQIRATNGSLFVSSAARTRTATQTGADTFALQFEDNLIPFAQWDILRAQRFTGSGVYQSNVRVVEIDGNTVHVERISGSDNPAVGMDFVRLGNTTNTSRQGNIYLTSDDSGAPFIDIVDGITSHADWNDSGKTKVRLGRLDGITDADFPGMSGYGLYTDSAYLKGTIVAGSGLIGGWTIDTVRIWKRLEYTGYNVDTVLRADDVNEIAGLHIFREESSTRRIMIQVGRLIGTNYSWTNNWGINFIARLGSSTERKLFEVSQDHTSPLTFNAQIAGWSFDWSKFWTGSGSDFVGMQQRATSTTRVFYAGATSNTGADAKFYVQANGQLFHASILAPIIMGTRHAGSAAADFVPTLVTWSVNQTSYLLKAGGNFAKRLGMNNIVIKARGSVETGGAIGQAQVVVIRTDTGATVISNTSLNWNTVAPDTQDLTLNLDISAQPDNVVYRVHFSIRRAVGSNNIFVRDPNIFVSNAPWS